MAIAFASMLSGWKALGAETEEQRFNIQSYAVRGGASISSNTLKSVLAKHRGPSVRLTDLVGAAADLQSEYGKQGYTNLSVAIALERITNGIATVNLFHGLAPQILISGKRFPSPNLELAATPTSQASTNTPTGGKTNAPIGFLVRAYEITGDTLLSTNTLMSIFAKRTGTNVTINDIIAAASELQEEYKTRGYPTVVVSLPQQKLTNGMVKIRVFEGKISSIDVVGNHYFSSNNVMRSLPSLHTNIILNGPLFQSELDRANGNQDRQIYAEMQPGSAPDTTDLLLRVKDRLPLHGKVEFNNQSSPGTPELRVNSSASYNNLWQL